MHASTSLPPSGMTQAGALRSMAHGGDCVRAAPVSHLTLPVPGARIVPGTVRAGIDVVGGGRTVVVARSVSGRHRGALSRADGMTIAEAAHKAREERLPLVVVVSSSGAEVTEGLDALDGWGRAAAAIAACSGTVPVLAAVTGPALSGPALLLGLADLTVMTPGAFAFVSGPDVVEGFTGQRVSPAELGGATMHATRSGLCALLAPDDEAVPDLLGAVLAYLPDHADASPPELTTDDPDDRATPELGAVIPAAASASYDVRDVVAPSPTTATCSSCAPPGPRTW